MARKRKKACFGSELLLFQYMQYLLTINNSRNKKIHSHCVRYFGTGEKTITQLFQVFWIQSVWNRAALSLYNWNCFVSPLVFNDRSKILWDHKSFLSIIVCASSFHKGHNLVLVGTSKHNLPEKLEEKPTIQLFMKNKSMHHLKGRYESEYFTVEESLWCSISNTEFGVRRPQFLAWFHC